jgi:hypothetical protein
MWTRNLSCGQCHLVRFTDLQRPQHCSLPCEQFSAGVLLTGRQVIAWLRESVWAPLFVATITGGNPDVPPHRG